MWKRPRKAGLAEHRQHSQYRARNAESQSRRDIFWAGLNLRAQDDDLTPGASTPRPQRAVPALQKPYDMCHIGARLGPRASA